VNKQQKKIFDDNNSNNTANAFDYNNYSPYTYKQEQNRPPYTNKPLDDKGNLKDMNFEKIKNNVAMTSFVEQQHQEQTERISNRNNKLRSFLKEIKTENKNIGRGEHKIQNDFSNLTNFNI